MGVFGNKVFACNFKENHTCHSGRSVEQITASNSMDSMISFISNMCLHFSVSHLSSVGEVRLRSVGTASNWILFPP